jgi:hypothetical protein
MVRPLTFGNTPVPYTVSWTEEEHFFVGRCAYFGKLAICQRVAPGKGQPAFGKPHSQRQRETIARGFCDLCGRTLKDRTKVSLSHARPVAHGAEGLAILQVEPLLHRECAALSMNYCPSLRRDIRAGTLMVRQVTRWRAQCAVMSPEYVGTIVGSYQPNPDDRILGHAKVELMNWIDRDEAWLGNTTSSDTRPLSGPGIE